MPPNSNRYAFLRPLPCESDSELRPLRLASGREIKYQLSYFAFYGYACAIEARNRSAVTSLAQPFSSLIVRLMVRKV